MTRSGIFIWLLASSIAATCSAQQHSPDQTAVKQFIESNCLDCHDKGAKNGGLALDDLLATDIDRNPEAWEKVVRKLTARQMPPKECAAAGRSASTTRPSPGWNRRSTRAAARQPNPGRTETFRRLNRTEYQNAIRDLLALESTSRRSCRRTSRVMASTTSRSPISRRRC